MMPSLASRLPLIFSQHGAGQSARLTTLLDTGIGLRAVVASATSMRFQPYAIVLLCDSYVRYNDNSTRSQTSDALIERPGNLDASKGLVGDRTEGCR